MNAPRPLRVALLTHSVRPRGGVVHTIELAHALRRRGHAVTIVASAEQGETLYRTVDVPVSLIRLPVLAGTLVDQVRQRIATLVHALPALLAAGRFDLVHAQDSLSGNALATLREAGLRVPTWLRTVHHLDRFEAPVLNEWQERAWRHADGLACVSDSWQAHFHATWGIAATRMFNGVNLDVFKPASDRSDEALLEALGLPASTHPACLLVGGVEARKNTLRVLEAFARLRQTCREWRDARLVIAGGASMLDHRAARDAWRERVAALDLAEGPDAPVLRTGPLPDAAIPALMRRASVLAMPSLVEGFGLAALEALACGTPVLVSRRQPFIEHLADTPGVAWCDPESVTDIADGLQAAARLPRHPIPPPVCIDYSWDRSARLHEAWYRQALDDAASVAIPIHADLVQPTL